MTSTTSNHPTAAQPIDLDYLEALATAATPGPWEATRQTDDECNFIGYYIEAGNKTISDDGTAPDSNDAQYIAAANPATLLALINLARQQPAASEQASAAPSSKDAGGEPVAMISAVELRDIQSGRMGVPVRGAGWREDQDIALYLAAPAPHAQAEPAARVDRIISASGLAEVSVFLESALKVGTVFYAASGAGEVAASVKTWQERSEAAMQTANWYPAGHYKDLEIADLRAQLAAAPAAPHAQAEPRYQEQFDGEYGSSVWHDVTEAAYHTFLPAHRRTLCAAPVPQEAEQAATAAVSLEDELVSMVRVKSIRDTIKPGDGWDGDDWDFALANAVAHAYRAQPAAPAVTDAVELIVRDVYKLDYSAGEWDEEKMLAVQVEDLRLICKRHIAAPAVTDAARDVLADDRYLNDDCDAPMKNGACTVCGFGPCRRTQSKE